MTVRKLKEEDYETLKIWWRKWRWTPPVKEILPDNGTAGFIVYDEDTPVVAGFLYDTNSSIAWVEWVVSNFDYRDKEGRNEAISTLLVYLEALAKVKGKKVCYSLLKSKSLIEAYKEQGYIPSETGYTEMIKTI
jgi:hypothetical protein